MSLLNIVQLIQVNQAPLIVAETVHLINQQKLAPLFTWEILISTNYFPP